MWRLSEVDGTCAEAENSERCFCSTIAGVAKWWHLEGGGGGGGEGENVLQTVRQTDVSRTAWASV